MNSHGTTRNPHITPRQKAREIAFQFIYRFDQQSGNDVIPAQVFEEFTKHAAHFQCPEESLAFATRLADTTLRQLKSIDEMIQKHAQNWKIERIGAVEKAFLRMGTAELLFFKDVPASVTLNEVIEMSKDFGEAETPAFLNGILDPISQESASKEGKVQSTS